MSFKIIDDKITFKNTNQFGAAGRQNDFSLSFSQIKIVGLKFMYLLDDDEYFVVFIDSAGQSYFLNSAFFDEQSFKKLQEVFNLRVDITNFDDSYYKQKRSIIIYPQSYYGKPLFENRKSFFRTVGLFFSKLFAFRNPAWGQLSEESKTIIAPAVGSVQRV